MQEIINASKDLLRRRFVRYVFVGGTTFAIDFGLLVVLHGMFGVNLLLAASISYWTSIIFNFFVNRAWTFGVTETHVGKHAAFYLSLLAINYTFSLIFIQAGTSVGMHYTIAKVIATAAQTIWTYIAYKRVVFRDEQT